MTSRRPKIVVLGMMTKMPVGGVVWQNLHYLLGFERLGYEVYYVESHARTPSAFMEHELDDGSGKAATFIAKTMSDFDLRHRWAFVALHEDGRPYGLSQGQLTRLYAEAALIINLHGATVPLPQHYETGRLVYLETDPGQLQVELHDGVAESYDFLSPHCAFFTFAENLGMSDCGLPGTAPFEFRPTRQPVVVDLWETNGGAPRHGFTTIGNWRQKWRTVNLHGEAYTWSKDSQFEKFLALPGLSAQSLELALASYQESDRDKLEQHGWRVRDAAEISRHASPYRRYVSGSRGEFTAAKEQNVRLRTGWFSDRSATYLAAGRPVITEDTGFGNAVPTGEGLIPVSDVEEAAEAITRVGCDYRRHRAAAAAIAREHFAAERVLGRLLESVGLAPSLNGHGAVRKGGFG